MDPSNLNCSVQELLAKQLDLVQQALAFNQAITRRLDLERGADAAPPPAPAPPGEAAALQPAAQPARAIALAKSDLSEPLLQTAAQQVQVVPEGRERQASADSSDGRSGRKRGHGRQSVKMTPQPNLFPNVEDLKGRVLQQLNKPEYHVEDLYSEEGAFQRVATSTLFQNVALAVIAMNSLWIAYETDNNKEDVLCNAPMQFQVVDNLFCMFFVFEITMRFMAFSDKCNAFKDGWWLFDFSLVALMVWETWIQVVIYKMVSSGADSSGAGSHTHLTFLRIFRILRLTRVARMVRLMRQVPELVILIKGIAMAARSVSATLALLMVIVYVFAVLFTQLLSGTPAGAGCFDTVPGAMICLVHEGVFTEQSEFLNKLLEVDWSYYAFMLVYLVFASLTVLNMLIGVLCEVVSVVAQVEREDMLVKDLQRQIGDLMKAVDPENDETVSKRTFGLLMNQVQTTHILHQVGVDVVALVQFGDFIFREKEELALGDFLATVLQFRGTNTATVKDIVDLRKFVSREIVAMEQRMDKEA